MSLLYASTLLASGLSTPVVDVSASAEGVISVTYTTSYTEEEVVVEPSETAVFGLSLPDLPVFTGDNAADDALMVEWEAAAALYLDEVAQELNDAGIEFKARQLGPEDEVVFVDTTTLEDSVFSVDRADADRVNALDLGTFLLEAPSDDDAERPLPICAYGADEFAAAVPGFDITRDEVFINDTSEDVCSIVVTMVGDSDELSSLETDLAALTGADVVFTVVEDGSVTATLEQAPSSGMSFSFTTASGSRQEMVVGETVMVVDPVEEEVAGEVVEEVIDTVEEAESNDTVIGSENSSGAPVALIVFALLALAGAGAGFFVYRKRNLDITAADDEEDATETA